MEDEGVEEAVVFHLVKQVVGAVECHRVNKTEELHRVGYVTEDAAAGPQRATISGGPDHRRATSGGRRSAGLPAIRPAIGTYNE